MERNQDRNPADMVDDEFLFGVTRSAVILAIVTFVTVLGFGFTEWAAEAGWAGTFIRLSMGFAAGGLLSIVAYEVLRQSGRVFLPDPDEEPPSFWTKVGYGTALFLKLPVFVVYMYFVVSAELFHSIGFLVGLATIPTVFILQVLGLLMTAGISGEEEEGQVFFDGPGEKKEGENKMQVEKAEEVVSANISRSRK